MWNVAISKRAGKQIQALPYALKSRVFALLKEIECGGPVRGDWMNYGKLPQGKHHCHIKKGKPTYVAIWEETGIQSVEVTFIGTHERAPY